ncbi:hypothetical protein P692DRAFT_20821828 [Suillus brevipes Sb2]|nr:hypothetical protein P692DRAFT_20821828 [Suillus brevipes Sb2]
MNLESIIWHPVPTGNVWRALPAGALEISLAVQQDISFLWVFYSEEMDKLGRCITNHKSQGIFSMQLHRQFNISSSIFAHLVDKILGSAIGTASHANMFDLRKGFDPRSR